MKKISLLLTLIVGTFMSAQTVFINEIHYDNDSTDADEAVEIAGPAGTDLSSYTILLYNGNGGEVYLTKVLTGVIPDQLDGFGTLNFPISGMQNGAPGGDGIALVNGTTLIQFLSYEGSFLAVGGVADGVTSLDIGVSEATNTPLGESLQLSGVGAVYSDFTWQAPVTATQGSVNTGQTFDSTVLSNPEHNALENESVLYPNPSITGEVTLQTSLTSELEVSIYNSLGTAVSTQMVSNSQAISTKELTAAIYFVQLTVNGNTTTKRLVVQ